MRFLIELPRWSLLALLIYAPWAFGCTPPWAIDLFNKFTFAIIIFWLVGCGVRRTWPRVHPVAFGCAVFLLFQGWWMVLNAQYFYDRNVFQFVEIPCIWKFAPGVLDRADAAPTMVRITGLLGILCFVCDLAQRPEWRHRLWWTIGIAGVSVVLFGLILRVTGEVRWSVDGTLIPTFFASYLYSSNAGAFINLVLPPTIGLAIVALRSERAGWARGIWVPGAVVCLAGAIAAASKAAMGVTAVLALIMAGAELVKFVKRSDARPSSLSLGFGAAGAVVLVFGILAIGWDAAMRRWSSFEAVQASWNARWLAYDACAHMLPDSGAWGFGAGNFAITFPHYTNYLGPSIAGRWEFAHEDYLETLIEWGWVGAAVWGLVLIGGVIHGCLTYSRGARTMSRADRMLLFTSVLALIGVALHALVDFPLQIASLQLYAAVYLGLAWGSTGWSRTK